jgi:hypothetical protein
MFEIVDLKRDLNMKLADQRIEMKAILRQADMVSSPTLKIKKKLN